MHYVGNREWFQTEQRSVHRTSRMHSHRHILETSLVKHWGEVSLCWFAQSGCTSGGDVHLFGQRVLLMPQQGICSSGHQPRLDITISAGWGGQDRHASVRSTGVFKSSLVLEKKMQCKSGHTSAVVYRLWWTCNDFRPFQPGQNQEEGGAYRLGSHSPQAQTVPPPPLWQALQSPAHKHTQQLLWTAHPRGPIHPPESPDSCCCYNIFIFIVLFMWE